MSSFFPTPVRKLASMFRLRHVFSLASLILLVPGTPDLPAQPVEAPSQGRTVQEWIAELKQDPKRATAAANALGRMGPQAKAAVDPLITLLATKDDDLAGAVIRALARIKAPAIPGLIRALNAEDIVVQRRAINALGLIGPAAKEAVLELVRKLADRKTEYAAQVALGNIGAEAAAAVPILIEGLRRDFHADFELPIHEALEKIGKPATGPLLSALKDSKKPPALRQNSALILAQIVRSTPEARSLVPVLRAALKEPELRWDAILALGTLGPDARPALPDLLAGLKDSDDHVRRATAFSILEIDREREHVNLLVTMVLKDPDSHIRRELARRLGDLSPVRKADVSPLLRAVNDTDSSKRQQAVQALSILGKDRKLVLAALLKALDDRDLAVQRSALNTLAGLGTEAVEVLPTLHELLRKTGDVRWKAHLARTIAHIRPAETKGLVPDIARWLQSSNHTVLVQHSAEILGLLGPEAAPAVLPLTSHLKPPSPEGSVVAVALGRIGPAAKEAIPALTACLQQEDRRYQLDLAAACALLQVNPTDTRAAAAVIDLRLSDRNQDIFQPLGAVGPAARKFVPALTVLARDPVLTIRREALEALRKIDPEAARKAEMP